MSNRARILLSIAIASLAAYLYLGISIGELLPRGTGVQIVQQFAGAFVDAHGVQLHVAEHIHRHAAGIFLEALGGFLLGGGRLE